MRKDIKASCSKRLSRIEGQVLRENATMLAMCAELGFAIEPDADDPGIVDVALDLK